MVHSQQEKRAERRESRKKEKRERKIEEREVSLCQLEGDESLDSDVN